MPNSASPTKASEGVAGDTCVDETDHLSIRTFEDALRWLELRNPSMATNRPQDLDWAAIKNEGRRY